MVSLLNPDKNVREPALKAFFRSLGSSAHSRLCGLLSAEVTTFSTRYWPALLPSLFFSASHNQEGNGASHTSNGFNTKDQECKGSMYCENPALKRSPLQPLPLQQAELKRTYSAFFDVLSTHADAEGGDGAKKGSNGNGVEGGGLVESLADLALIHLPSGDNLWQQCVSQLWDVSGVEGTYVYE